MPKTIVDLSARSEIIRDEPWHLHFWELTPTEFAEQAKNPREFMRTKLGIDLPESCVVTTEIVNHDWISSSTNGFAIDDGVIICNVGGGNVALAAYRITSYGHKKDDVAKYKKTLLHKPSEQKVSGT